ncbi:E3 ubiquitin-protein ligase RNF26 [Apteryx mantelli]|uniref:E3 ubiquitin-protein ligase RNF26 n=1 Tax=Apteryx mantelli TaxID=2696672 RepID=A0A8B7JM41_9AVES|nr:PREDICTED: RING finger protein 26 isoform X1 [Apteryx mantelli mantelli]XP_013812133.1 PREDICTED: RING finger protein 26 isoform X2 [Apteryx mantelli mantelli]
MDLVFLLLRGLRLALDLLGFVLDVNFFLVSSLVSALLWLVALVYNLPSTAAAGALTCWNGMLLCLASLAEAACCLALDVLHGLAGLLRGCCSSLEGLKVVGHLLSHLALRSRELLHRGLCNLLSSGQTLVRQVCEGLAICMSLLAYLVNSIINMCLIGMQNLFTLVVALWDSIVSPFLRVTDLLAAFLAHVSSSAIALSILLWSPCQLAFEVLTSVIKLLINVFFVNIYGLVLLIFIIVVSTFVFNPGLLWTLAGHVLGYLNTLPSYHRLQRDAWRLYQVAVLTLGMVMTSQAWRRLVDWSLQVADWSLQVASWSRGGRMINQESNQRGAAAPAPRPAAPGRGVLAAGGQLAGGEHEDQPAMEQVPHARPALARSTVTGQRLQPPREEPSTSWAKAPRREQLNAAAWDGEAAPDDDPWRLLKEQEERKKCVICQDQTKTVLLLPCRHLCLCQECTEVLLQQAIYQRNCPLCRQMILQTLNVYL